ncbi:hypothetical protein SLEP1_g23079 [Rubroshorea leprosula]|uniref:Uncharacterized protein n=1 Tax=Rubroshorea leprosula TaxID=152421 RepID=A0AAV5JNA3_9ROSI|nr:hypothetical protein SLEP1_g23079 [Rubroshorea leprosula]
MELFPVQFFVMEVSVLALAIVLPSIGAESPAPAPAPTTTSDGVTVDQGVAYVLMLLALVITYIVH